MPTKHSNPIEIKGNIVKVDSADDGVFLNLQSFTKLYRVFVPTLLADGLDFPLETGREIKALSIENWRAGFWVAQGVKLQ